MRKKVDWVMAPTTAAVAEPQVRYRIDFSVTNESARLTPSRKLVSGEEITVVTLTGNDWTPITVMSPTENPGGIMLMGYGYYGVIKEATTEPLGVYIDRL